MASAGTRIFGLDLLRAFAILFVVAEHGLSLLDPYVYGYRLGYFDFDGVSLFFVLSGFLIGKILLKEINRPDFGVKALQNFWVRRWMRTLPNYLLILVLLISAYRWFGLPVADHVLPYFFFSQNLAWPHPKFFGEAWSLSIEEWFYLSIPLPFLLTSQLKFLDRRRLILFVIFFVIFSVMMLRFYRAYHYDYSSLAEWDGGLRKQVITRLDSLMYGVAGAYLSLYKSEFWAKYSKRFLVIGVAIILLDKVLSTNHVYLLYIRLSATPLGALLMLPFLSSWVRKADWLSKVVTHISVTSYAAYLLNQAVVNVLLQHIYRTYCASCINEPAFLYVIYWITTFGLAYLLYRFYELLKSIKGVAVAEYVVTADCASVVVAPEAATRKIVHFESVVK